MTNIRILLYIMSRIGLRLSLVLLLALMGQATLGAQTPQADKASLYYYRAARAASNEQAEAALALYRYARRLDPTDPAIAYGLGLQYGQRQDLDKALPLLAQAYQADSNNRDYMQGYTMFLASLPERRPEAIAILERWLSTQLSDEEAQQYLASLYFRSGAYQKAIDLYDKVRAENTALYPEYARLTLMRARLYDILGDQAKARRELDELIARYPHESSAKVRAIDYLYTQERHTEAKSYLEQLARDPGISQTQLRSLYIPYYRATGDSIRWAEALRSELSDPQVEAKDKLGNWQTFLQLQARGDTLPEAYNWVFEQIIREHPDALEVQQSYAKQLMLQGKGERALSYLMDLRKTMPEVSEIWTDLLSILGDQKRYSELSEIALEARRALPSEWSIVYLGAMPYVMQNRMAEGRRYLEEALPLLEQEGANDYGLSVLYALLGDLYESHNRRQCYEYYDKALEYNDHNSEVLNNYAYFLALEGKELERAEQMAVRGLKVREDNHNLLDTYAWILYLRGRYSLAELYIGRAIDKAGDELSGVHLDHYGDILAAQGQTDKARPQWTKAIELYQKELKHKQEAKAKRKEISDLKAKIKRLEKLLKQQK
ncbi:MAG: hypothetical protein SPK09_07785 [Porphyromonas sp.]|nr:hypothetical protein [Porphyromonas sp.]